jgi:hypothetical protein
MPVQNQTFPDTIPFTRASNFDIFFRLIPEYFDGHYNRGAVRVWIKGWLQRYGNYIPQDVQREFVNKIGLSGKCIQMVAEPDLRKHLHIVNKETIIGSGGSNRLIPDEKVKELVEDIIAARNIKNASSVSSGWGF